MDLLERRAALQAEAKQEAAAGGGSERRPPQGMRSGGTRVNWEESREFGALLLELNDKQLAARWRKLFTRR